DPWGKRVKVSVSGQDQWFFYSITGQRVGTFVVNANGSMDVATDPQTLKREVNRYFGGKLIQSNGLLVATDRLGSVRANSNGDQMRYKAYGQELTWTANGREKFGTYYRDGVGLDYADQRYYGSVGAFLSPDPGGMRTMVPANPGSWNRYSYVQGDDPVNSFDPSGLFQENPCWGDPLRIGCDPTAYVPSPGFNPGEEGAGGGGGGEVEPDPVAVSDRIMDRELQSAFARALKMLGNEPDCFALFGLPRAIRSGFAISSTSAGANSGFFLVRPIASEANTVTSATTTGVGYQQLPIGNDATVMVNSSVVIQLNNTSAQASFVSGTDYDQAIT